MKKSAIYIFVFQTFFYAATIFVVHLLLFDFWNPNYSSSYVSNWLPLLIIDTIGGLVVGAANGLPWRIFGKGEEKTNKFFILTAVVWLIFSFWWYSVNRGTLDREPAGHVISPVIMGVAGLFLAGLSFAYFLFRRRKV